MNFINKIHLHSPILLLVYLSILLAIGIYDYKKQKIPNRINLFLLIFSLTLATMNSFFYQDVQILVSSLKAFGFVSLVFIPLFALRVFGAGDVKLLMAIAAFLGFESTLLFLNYFFGILFISAVLMVLFKGQCISFFKSVFESLKTVFIPGQMIFFPKFKSTIKVPVGITMVLAYAVLLFQ
jgi:prepilin peptidase CpaA